MCKEWGETECEERNPIPKIDRARLVSKVELLEEGRKDGKRIILGQHGWRKAANYQKTLMK